MRTTKRLGVSVLIGVLLMVVAAVLLSVAVFGWSVGFLSGIGNTVGGQTPLQNQATMASLVIENSKAQAYSSTVTDGKITIFVRNVGTFSPLVLGSVGITALPLNGGLKTSVISTLQSGTWSATSIPNLSVCSTTTTATDCSGGTTLTSLQNLNSAEVFIIWPKATTFASGNYPLSGDTLTITVSTTVGAQSVVTIVVP